MRYLPVHFTSRENRFASLEECYHNIISSSLLILYQQHYIKKQQLKSQQKNLPTCYFEMFPCSFCRELLNLSHLLQWFSQTQFDSGCPAITIEATATRGATGAQLCHGEARASNCWERLALHNGTRQDIQSRFLHIESSSQFTYSLAKTFTYARWQVLVRKLTNVLADWPQEC